MPEFIKVEYEIPKKNNNEDLRKYLLRVIYDVKYSLTKLNAGEEPNLYETLGIINAGGNYISRRYPIIHKIDLSEVKNLIKDYEKTSKKKIEEILENSGQLISSK
ncbi:MAG: hypothetical protein WC584_03775 [Candidatus Pacearchaeota archaeon]